MPQGPGKYDEVCEHVRETTKAKAVVVVVLDGEKGTGMSMTTTDWTMVLDMPSILRKVAQDIEDSFPRQ